MKQISSVTITKKFLELLLISILQALNYEIMNYIDLFLLAILVYSALKGYKKGFIVQVASFGGLLLGILGAIGLSDVTSAIMKDHTGFGGRTLPFVAFVVTFVAIVIGVHFLAKIVEKGAKAVKLGTANRVFGVVLALVKMTFIISVFLVILNGIDRHIHILPRESVSNSFLYSPVSKFAPAVFPYLKPSPKNDKKQNKQEQKEAYNFINLNVTTSKMNKIG